MIYTLHLLYLSLFNCIRRELKIIPSHLVSFFSFFVCAQEFFNDHSNFYVNLFQLHHVDGLTKSRVRQLLEATENSTIDVLSLTGDSGCTWGAVSDLLKF